MKLYTECFWGEWHRIVDIYTERCDTIPDYINDNTTYKLIILEKGILRINDKGSDFEVKAPAFIMLSEKDKLSFRIMQKIKAYILFFKPSAIRDEFTFDRINSGEFSNMYGQNIYQDFTLIRGFTDFESLAEKSLALSMNGLERIKELFTSTEAELKGQRDGFWPCRSRSYFMELLFYIIYSCLIEAHFGTTHESEDKSLFSQITAYLNEHIEEQITLETVTKEFMINRNKLNDIFMQHSSMTCLNYLLNLRMDLAKILLTKTEIPIGEVSTRVGYPDANYFAKVFKKNVGVNPKKFRYS